MSQKISNLQESSVSHPYRAPILFISFLFIMFLLGYLAGANIP